MQSNKTLYRCSECGLNYTGKEIAKECQSWCRKNKSCNLDIAKLSVEVQKVKNGRST